MFKYNLSVSMSDPNLKISEEIKTLMVKAADEANSRRNASRKGRLIKINESIDDYHINITLDSKTEVIPTRALSALSRCMIELDTNGILDGHNYRGCILNSTLLTDENNDIKSISDVEMLQEIIDMLFNRTTYNNRDKKLATQTLDIIRNSVIEYINNKTHIK